VILTEEQLEQLTNEQLLGGKAQRAYDEFIGPFIQEKKLVLFTSFCNLPLTDTDRLMEVKRMMFAIETLESEINNVIETGKLASITLNEEEVKH
jgi:hypothetical protein